MTGHAFNFDFVVHNPLAFGIHELIIKKSGFFLKEHGVDLTTHFYARMFKGNPELKQIFNRGHQEAGHQQQALAAAVAAYAINIDNPSVLSTALTHIAHKHVSLGIRAEHYSIVGKHLLVSIKEALGDAADNELLDAWGIAYNKIAEMLIEEEKNIYFCTANKNGGWTGGRGFKVARKVIESSEITSFYLRPADEGAVPDYLPGQYISVRLFVPE
ncbi:globin domain-containing protein [Laribacter hongkongensis]|uniref:globin domain-containing protein n=1 Tax=Laribacter hongkongensis TaxID=168471 RepID=UPI001EFDBE18|nr:globin domain-containing protein [Laribacter hongkongensis]MCG9094005.1 globin domain-containing protein [Laribacter hongkongensis]